MLLLVVVEIVIVAHVVAVPVVASCVEQCDSKCSHALTNASLGSSDRILASTPQTLITCVSNSVAAKLMLLLVVGVGCFFGYCLSVLLGCWLLALTASSGKTHDCKVASVYKQKQLCSDMQEQAAQEVISKIGADSDKSSQQWTGTQTTSNKAITVHGAVSARAQASVMWP